MQPLRAGRFPCPREPRYAGADLPSPRAFQALESVARSLCYACRASGQRHRGGRRTWAPQWKGGPTALQRVSPASPCPV